MGKSVGDFVKSTFEISNLKGAVTAAKNPGDLSKVSISGWGVFAKEGGFWEEMNQERGGDGGKAVNAFKDPMGLYGDGGDPVFARIGLGTEPKTPDIVEEDPIGDAEEAKRVATRSATARRSSRSKRSASLLGGSAPSLIRQGRGSLG